MPKHPRLFLNEAEIARLRDFVQRKEWLSRYVEQLIADLDAQIDNPPLPDADRSRNVGLSRLAHQFAIAYVLRNDPRYARAAATILNAYVDWFPKYEVTDLKGKAGHSALSEADWAVNAASAYDLIYQSGVLTADQQRAIEQQVLKPSAETLRICNHHFRSNWRARALAGFGVIGFCINDPDLIDEALNGLRDPSGKVLRDGFVQHVAWSILADGVFYERSMHYHLFTADSYTLLAEAARHRGVDLWNVEVPGHPKDAGADLERKFGVTGKKTMKSIFDSPFYEAFSDGSLVRLGNSYADRLERARCYERAWRAYRDPKYAWIARRPIEFYRPIMGGGYVPPEEVAAAKHKALGKTPNPEGRRPLTPLGLIWLAPELPEGHFDHSEDMRIGVTGQHKNHCTLLPNGGVTVLRQSSDENAVGVQMTFGDWASAHTHADQLAISVCAGKTHLVPEVRYHHYGHENFLSWDRQTIAHNTVTVDETSQYPQRDKNDSWVVVSGPKRARSRPIFFHAGQKLKAFRAICDVAYEGVVLDRTIVLIDGFVVDLFRCRSQRQHQYDYALHVDGRLADDQLKLQATNRAISEALGYQHMTNVRRRRIGEQRVALRYQTSNSAPQFLLQLLSNDASELIAAHGHPDLDGNSKDVLIQRKQGADVDFLSVMTFSSPTSDRETVAHRLANLPQGVVGVAITGPNGVSHTVLSAEEPRSFRHAGQQVSGQLILLKTVNGNSTVVDVVP
ncbi:MAG: heparinase II/III family protein [Pirellulales bacterium]